MGKKGVLAELTRSASSKPYEEAEVRLQEYGTKVLEGALGLSAQKSRSKGWKFLGGSLALLTTCAGVFTAAEGGPMEALRAVHLVRESLWVDSSARFTSYPDGEHAGSQVRIAELSFGDTYVMQEADGGIAVELELKFDPKKFMSIFTAGNQADAARIMPTLDAGRYFAEANKYAVNKAACVNDAMLVVDKVVGNADLFTPEQAKLISGAENAYGITPYTTKPDDPNRPNLSLYSIDPATKQANILVCPT